MDEDHFEHEEEEEDGDEDTDDNDDDDNDNEVKGGSYSHAELKSNFAKLEPQLLQLQSQESILTSTPFHPPTGTTHEVRNGRMSRVSPVSPLSLNGEVSPLPLHREDIVRKRHRENHVSSAAMETFEKLMQETVSIE